MSRTAADRRWQGKPPVAEYVTDGFCDLCMEPVIVDKIERGPRIGTRIRYRHVSMRPTCEGPLGPTMRRLYHERQARS